MIRKISTKAAVNQDKPRKLQLKTSDNQYYLPHPQARVVKTPIKDSSFEHQKVRVVSKNQKKYINNVPQRTYSTTNFKSDMINLSKQHDQVNNVKQNASKKVQSRKIRFTSNLETPRKTSSKSGFKVSLNSAKKQVGGKRLNLKIETPTTKKSEKINLNSMNFDNYYNNDCTNHEEKTYRASKRPESTQSRIYNSYQYSIVFARCKNLIEEYKTQLESVKKQNKILQEENKKLKQQNFYSRKV